MAYVKSQDTLLFIETLQDISGIKLLREHVYPGNVRVMVFEGTRGNAVSIDVTDEEIPDEVCKDHFYALGIGDLVEAYFK